MSRACVFLAGGQRFAIRADRVKEVVHLEQVTRVPLTPSHLLGVSNLRGTILPVVDLRSVVGVDEPGLGPVSSRATLSCEAAGLEVGLAADEVLGIEELPERALRPVATDAPDAMRRLAVGAVERAGETTTLLDIDVLIRDLKIVQPVRLAEAAPALAPAPSPARREAWQ